MAKNFHYHNTEEQLKITISFSNTKFGMRTFAYQAYFFTWDKYFSQQKLCHQQVNSIR